MEIRFEVKLQIDTLDLFENFVAFRVRRYQNNKLVSEFQDITTKENLAEMTAFGEFKSSKYDLWARNILEIHLKSKHDSDYFDELNKALIETPYDVVENNPDWQEKYFLGRYDMGSEDFINTNGVYQPKAIYVDYTTGMSNYHYDLAGVLSEIKDLPNVRCLSNTIETIPWYNQSEGNTNQICFVFMPTIEEYQKLHKLMPHERATKVVEMLGLQKFKHDAQDED